MTRGCLYVKLQVLKIVVLAEFFFNVIQVFLFEVYCEASAEVVWACSEEAIHVFIADECFISWQVTFSRGYHKWLCNVRHIKLIIQASRFFFFFFFQENCCLI